MVGKAARCLAALVLGVCAPWAWAQDEAAERPVYFVRDVAPIFDREGCSGGACHGKIGGQGNLAISLMTLSPVMDHAPLEPFVNLNNPEASLLLRKPTMAEPHGGGQRFDEKSDEYETLLTWIRQGCRNPQREPLPVRLWVKPERFVFDEDTQKGRIEVFCEFADGAVEEVTDRTRFISQDDQIASVTRKGYVRAERWGMTAIMCRYVGLTKPVFISMPRPAADDDPQAPKLEAKSIIDAVVFKNLEWLNLVPATMSDDYTFLRRVHLDLVGALPEPELIEAFVADDAPDKRAKMIDRLLDDPRFDDLRTLRLGDMLRINPDKLANGPLQERAALVFDTWLRDQVAQNRPYNDFVHELITATGSSMQYGAASFYRVERSPQDRAETLGQAFLGVRLACARCHNHPFDRWTTDDYWQFAAFMSKVRERNGELYNEGVIYHGDDASLRNQSVVSENKGKVALPTFLGGDSLDPKSFSGSYIPALADWVVDPENPYFAKAAVNRIWSHLFGRGIIDPVDDFRETSVATVPTLLPVLADEFARLGYDTKELFRLLCNSTTYQLAADANATSNLDDRFFSHYMPKQMMAQVLLDALNTACGTSDRFGNFPDGTTAVSLPLPERNGFLDKFGRSRREFLAELDPHVEPTLPQTLHMINSGYINQKVARGGTLQTLLKQHPDDDDALIRALYLRTLSRPPSDEELAKVRAYFAGVDRREAAEDLLWALITSREFLFIS